MKQLYDRSLEGLKVRSRAAWFEDGEKNKEYFEQLLKSNKKKTIIQELYNEENRLTKETKEISKLIKSFYETLYSKKSEVNEDVLNKSSFSKSIPKLSEESREACEGKISKDECYEVLKTMKLNKAPGNDGFSVEFYITFWLHIGEQLVEAVNDAYDRGNLSTSQKQGVITLIEKDGKDPLYIKNYRPITLLNVDYKILSKVLAKRMKKVLREIIHIDQVGYMDNRNIGEAIRSIDDMIFHCLTHNLDCYLIAVDFEKAFDSVSHSFLLSVLKWFGFGPSFCSWIKTIYTDTSSCVMNGGRSTGYFKIERGVRQGDPLSPYLFLVAIEVLAHALRKETTVKGMSFGAFEIKQVLYADDMTIFIRDKASINKLQNLFQEFLEMSGLKVNIDKTKILLIGKNMDNIGEFQFGSVVTEVKILGITFSLDIKRREEFNYKEILSKIKRLLGWWKQRDLTIMGKIHLLKTYALSKLNYVSSSSEVPKWLFAEIQKICFDFIWKGKDRIKRLIMYQDYKDGGLRMVNFELFVKTQRVMWVKRLLYGEQHMSWKLYFDEIFSSVGGRSIFLCNYETNKLSLKAPLFYVEMLKAWQDLYNCRNFEEGKINPIIFNNRDFLLKGKMAFNADIYRRNVYHLEQLFDKESIRPVTHFHSLGLTSLNIVYIWNLCDSILKSGKYDGTSCNWYEVDIKNYENIFLNFFGQIITLRDVQSRKIYAHFVSVLQNSYCLEIRDGHQKFDFQVKDMKDIFVRPRISTLIGELREFQYKLLHGAVYTKEQLLKFGFVGDNLCSFCNKNSETYSHLFWNCTKIGPLWQDIIDYFQLEELTNVEWQDIHVGIEGASHRIKLCNTVIFITKFMIYKARSQLVTLSLAELKKIFITYREEEKNIAIKRNKTGLHLLKWELLNST